MASTRDLRPEFRPYADWLLDIFRYYDPEYMVTSGRRTTADQIRLYARWESGDPTVLTPARPGTSQHEKGWAVDIARASVPAPEDTFLVEVGRWWRSIGGVWGGERDPVHFEAPRAWTGRR